ncbi:hypothetical protein [Pseudooceanicola sp.]|uniref:hypothetical protein n=1 Tax=Pseudooceanicola sp. TaxID=1914328 RepID=UPI0040595A4F
MTAQDNRLANAPAVHIELEPFHVIAAPQLAESPLAESGICMNPCCSRPFPPTRPWQVYCCEGCRRAGEAEFRAIGHRAAPALLAWRLGKYERADEALRDLSRAGRRYLGTLASEWVADRARRSESI